MGRMVLHDAHHGDAFCLEHVLSVCRFNPLPSRGFRHLLHSMIHMYPQHTDMLLPLCPSVRPAHRASSVAAAHAQRTSYSAYT